jgi:hypothetical protein
MCQLVSRKNRAAPAMPLVTTKLVFTVAGVFVTEAQPGLLSPGVDCKPKLAAATGQLTIALVPLRVIDNMGRAADKSGWIVMQL